MYDPYFNSLNNLIDVGNTMVYDDIQFYADLATINAITEKNLQTRYVDESTGDEYRWNGTTLILMNSGSGATSLTAGTNINLTGTAPNTIINVDTDPSFNTVTLTTQTDADHAVRKDYVDNLALINLIDVDTTGAQATNALVYNGSEWTPAPTTIDQDVTSSVLFDVPFNTNTNDVSSFATAGTIVGTLAQVVGILGNAYENSANGNYITYGYVPRLNFKTADPFSICFWFKSNDTGTTSTTILSQAEGANGSGWQISTRPSGHRIEFKMSDVNTLRTCDIRWEFTSGLYDGNWHFICLVHRTNNGYLPVSLDLYLDGVIRNDVKSTITSNLTDTDDIQVVSAPLNVFSRNNGEGSEFVGVLDNIQIYNFSFFGPYPVESLWNNGIGKQNPDYTIKTLLEHDHPITQVRGLQQVLDNKVSTITNTDGNITITDTTSIDKDINLSNTFIQKSGSYIPLLYSYKAAPIVDGTQISGNTSLISTVNVISIGYLPSNRGLPASYEYIEQLLIKMRGYPPWKLRMINTVNNLRATFLMNYTGQTVANTENYSVTVIASETNMVNMPTTGNNIICFFDPYIPRNANEILTNTAGNYTTATNTQTNINQLDTQLGLNTTQLGTNTNQLTFMNKNTTENSNILFFNSNAPVSAFLDLYSFQADGSFDYVSPTNNITWNRCVVFNLLHKRTILKSAPPRKLFFAVQLYGIGWATNPLGYEGVLIGFTTEGALETVQNWMTSEYISGYTGVWNTGLTDKEKMIRARFITGGVEWVYGGANLGARFGNPNMQPTANDVLLVYLDTNGTFNLELRASANYTVVKTRGTIAHPDGVKSSNNFNLSPLCPVFSSLNNNIDYGIRVLSKRATDALSITVSDGENIFW